MQFLRKAKRTTNRFDEQKKINCRWFKACDLEPVIKYLSAQ